MDHLDADIGQEENRITVHFNIPVRLVSQLINKAGNEITVQLQPTLTPGFNKTLLDTNETLSWHSSAEIPLRRVEYRGETIGLSSLSYSFATPIISYVIEESGDAFSISLLLNKSTTVREIKTAAVPMIVTPKEVADGPAKKQNRIAAHPSPQKGYVVNLASRKVPIDFSKVAPIPVANGKQLYTSKTTLEDQVWYRLRLGIYNTAEEAKSALKEIKHYYPKAWIDRAKAGELIAKPSEGAATPSIDQKLEGVRLPSRGAAPSKPSDRTSRMILKAREVMTAGDYPVAIRLLTAVLEDSNTTYHHEALEMLGLAREQNKQFTHATTPL